jgi:hypothetical protein
MNNKCVKIISINKDKDLVFHKEEYRKIINQAPHNLPVVVLSIIGPYRTGKFFFTKFNYRFSSSKINN